MLHKNTVFLVASALPLLMVSLVAPRISHELDVWLMWVGAMVLVGLPVLLAEFALSARSGTTPWLGMQKLTREADASFMWRLFSGLSVLVAVLMAASITSRLALGVWAYLPSVAADFGMPAIALSAAFMVLALILSLLKDRLLPVGLLLVVIGAAMALFGNGVNSEVGVPMMTEVTFGDFAKAVILALLSVGVGTGLYWFGLPKAMNEAVNAKKSLFGLTFPIWLTQLVFGSFALLAGSAMTTPLSFMVSGLGMLFIAAFFLYYASSQLTARLGLLIGGITTLVLALLFAPIPFGVLAVVLVVLGLISVLNLSVFAGFIMKISHLRKTLNFTSEGRYNLWRVLVRIVVPVVVCLALVGWLIGWL
ncbi:hypothetical protein LU293_01880 [Moraxella nasovis]|uniref:hypothetical protein n=1 Tax=Moraxella nasovis TaxID=2904121 RepID=UPI001F61B82A|nr:hypothetical protein [Moraxella nasovis]UNU73685.1 hypothetical protein LU293_01880 [Moraxella nasovis]